MKSRPIQNPINSLIINRLFFYKLRLFSFWCSSIGIRLSPLACFEIHLKLGLILKRTLAILKRNRKHYCLGFRKTGIHPAVADIKISHSFRSLDLKNWRGLGIKGDVIPYLFQIAPSLCKRLGGWKFAWIGIPSHTCGRQHMVQAIHFDNSGSFASLIFEKLGILYCWKIVIRQFEKTQALIDST